MKCLYLIIIIYYYNVFLTIFSWKKYEKPDNYITDIEQTFSILIPCHNEEEVIVDNLTHIFNSTYNLNKINVFVIADNCTDDTVKNVNEFIDGNKIENCYIIQVKGYSKPRALNLAIEHIKANGMWNADNIMILDSDNKISNTMLEAYNYYHSKNNPILQCRILSDNDDTIIAKGFTSSFNNMSLGFQIARNRLGLSASLSGTGFSIDRNVFDEVDFMQCDTLTEDLEFSVMSILKGYKIKYIHEQYVMNQNLDEFRPSITQRIRWCRGHMQVSVKMSAQLIKKFISKPSMQLVDTFLFINTPIKSVLYTLGALYIFFTVNDINILFIVFNIVVLIYNIIYMIWYNDKKLSYVLPHIIYYISMYIIIIYGALTFRNNKWVKTKHKKIKS